MRILGLDFGDKTIGVAVSDPFGWTAQGLCVIPRENPNAFKKPMNELSTIITEKEVETIVLGFPKNMDNTEGSRCAKTEDFAERIRKRFPKIPVILWDERLSTVAANRTLMEGNLSRMERKSVIDKMAAVHILQGYLDKLANEKKEQ
ncbi:MAG: Holliday junction resolvase RuvX [Bacillota bacterium]